MLLKAPLLDLPPASPLGAPAYIWCSGPSFHGFFLPLAPGCPASWVSFNGPETPDLLGLPSPPYFRYLF